MAAMSPPKKKEGAMATYNNENDSYASRGVGNAGLALGIIGTSLASGILNGNGLGSGLFGNSNRATLAANDAVTLAMAQKDAEIAQLKADQATDAKLVEVYKDLRAQDKAQDSVISGLKDRIAAIETASPLREQIVLGQVQAVAQSVAFANAQVQTQIAGIQATLSGITRTIVPSDAVCPQPMPLHNSWTAPTASSTT
jgi:hypothetical protein